MLVQCLFKTCLFGTGRLLGLRCSWEPLTQTTSHSTLRFLGSSAIHLTYTMWSWSDERLSRKPKERHTYRDSFNIQTGCRIIYSILVHRKHLLPYRYDDEWQQHLMRSLPTWSDWLGCIEMSWPWATALHNKFHTTFLLCQPSCFNFVTLPQCHPGVLLCIWPVYPTSTAG